MLRDEDRDNPLTEDDWPDETDLADDPMDQVVTCPYCGKGIHDESPQCPHCRNWVFAEDLHADVGPRQYAWWIILSIVIALLLATLGLLEAGFKWW